MKNKEKCSNVPSFQTDKTVNHQSRYTGFIQSVPREMSAASLFVGVDGGGTKTKAVCMREGGGVVGRSEGGASNYNSVGKESAKKVGLNLISLSFLFHLPSLFLTSSSFLSFFLFPPSGSHGSHSRLCGGCESIPLRRFVFLP